MENSKVLAQLLHLINRLFIHAIRQDALHRGRQGDHSTSKPQKFNILLIRSKPSVQSGN